MNARPRDLAASRSFVLRTPLLPLHDFVGWSAGVRAPSVADSRGLFDALRHDRELLRGRLRDVLRQPSVRDGVFVASPDLEASLDGWLADPESPAGRKVERALVRYFSRMTSRPTPFGLFSGVSSGTIAEDTCLRLAPRSDYRRHTRLDNEYLFALAEALADRPDVREVVRYRPSSSLYTAAGRIHYAEARRSGGRRTYHLVAVESSDELTAALARAESGATRREIVAAIAAGDPAIDAEDAEAYVDELVDAQLLVPELVPPVTGDPPIDALARELSQIPAASDAAQALARVRRRLEAIDGATATVGRADYEAVAAELEGLGAPVDLAGLVQVDMIKPTARATLGRTVLEEIERGVEILARLSPRDTSLQKFTDAFVARYEEREVPLTEVLDDEVGIGFSGPHATGGEAAPLLAGLAFPQRGDGTTTAWGPRERFLLQRLERLWQTGEHELALDDDDLRSLAVDRHAQIPDAFSTTTQIAAASEEALAAGDFLVAFDACGGPSGARLSGRFCHVSEEIRTGVLEHLRQEEATAPDAVFAEVAYMPEGRLGNVACRPLLRDHEIVYMGRSGAPADRRIALSDLLVSVRGGRVVLRSKRLDRQVVPRCTTAHNYVTHGFGAYRFLCSLQARDGGWVGFDWGPLGDALFLPRVRHGRLVFSVARWRLLRDDLEPLVRAGASAREVGASTADLQFAAVQALRARRRLPRHVLVADGDQELHVDLDNALSVDSFVHLVKGRGTCRLKELFPGPDELVVRGPEGAYRHQLLVSFVHGREHAVPTTPRVPTLATTRRFAPGTEWLYAKLYTGAATTDELLRHIVGPVAQQAVADCIAREWFFVRYRDTDWHLRVRMRGDAARVHAELAPLLGTAWQAALARDLAWRVQLDTYERELERYGGAAGIELAEKIAWCDSEAVLAIVARLSSERGLEARWRLALLGTDMLLDDLGLDLPTKLAIVSHARAQLGVEIGADAAFSHQLAAKYRRLRPELTALLEHGHEGLLAPGVEILRARSRALAPIAAELQGRARLGMLARPLPDLAWTHVHMHCNRLLRSAHRAQELVIHDFLARTYESRLARTRKDSGRHRAASS